MHISARGLGAALENKEISNGGELGARAKEKEK
jgi:hypothetical protein